MRRSKAEHGFTLVEVIVAMVVLLVGVMGMVKLIDEANGATVRTRARDNANNLAREVIERTRAVDYAKLTAATLASALQVAPELRDSTPSTPQWTLERGGTVYALTASTCIYDDGKDGISLPRDETACDSSPSDAPTTDANPDDFRRVDLSLTWRLPASGTNGSVRQSALIINPSGGLGPRITSFLPTGLPSPTVTITSPAATLVPFTVRSSPAATVRWTVDDAVSRGNALDGPTLWNFQWLLGTPLDAPQSYVGDGTYEVTAQAFDSIGVPGELKAATVVVNRSLPVAPAGLAGGRDTRFPSGPIVDLTWNPNAERDVLGYRVFRTGPDDAPETSDDVRVCPAAADGVVTTTACTDTSPVTGASRYFVQAIDTDSATNAKRPGTRSALLSVSGTATARPTFPAGANLTVTVVAGLPTLEWTPAEDADGTIRMYRIHRDSGSGYADRYNRTESSAARFTDPDPGATTAHTYWVTAIDDSFNESDPLGPVSSP